VDLSFNAEQQELRNTARRFLAEHAGPEARRRNATPLDYDATLWRGLSNELGVSALLVPERHGGLGLGMVELVAVMEEMGSALLSAPFFSSVCLAQPLLLSLSDHPFCQRVLPELAAGERLATLAHAGTVEARRSESGFVLSGSLPQVVDGASADWVIVAAAFEGLPALFALGRDTPGLTQEPRPTLDATRHQASLMLSEAQVPHAALLASGATAEQSLSHALSLARIALAAEQVGGAQRCLDMAVEYSGTRQQFGRPIGSFQAIKHICADMMVHVETARSAAYYAAAAAQQGDPALPEIAALAKVSCSEAFFFCAAQNIQVHGGIGFTWEHDAHLYFRRARSSMTLLGSPSEHREWLASRLLDPLAPRSGRSSAS
jgi:alkylation response protein AidB-like acyl-CoA dehydrogenase